METKIASSRRIKFTLTERPFSTVVKDCINEYQATFSRTFRVQREIIVSPESAKNLTDAYEKCMSIRKSMGLR